MTIDFDQIPGIQPELPEPAADETFHYLDADGEQRYVAIHHSKGPPKAQIILCPPFTIERTYAYTTMVRLSRSLSHAGFQVVRFDYRGMGESSGRTEVFGISDWLDDARDVVAYTARYVNGVPRILSGLRFGAFIAATLFEEGSGDALLALDPPVKIRQMLMDLLRRKLAEDFALGVANGKTKRNRSYYIAELERTGTVEVEGYLWGTKLWEESTTRQLPLPRENDDRAALIIHLDRRPETRVIAPGKSEVIPVPSPPFWGTSPSVLVEISALIKRIVQFAEKVSIAGVKTPPEQTARSSVHSQSEGSREIYTPKVGNHRLVFTIHRPTGAPVDAALVLYNGGQIPRNGHGGLSTKLGDDLSARGMTVYRVDLPGLGDSPGALPAKTDDLYLQNEEGQQIESAVAVLEHIKRELKHKQLIVGGLCGAANNALYAGAKHRHLVDGVVMLEVQFFHRNATGAVETETPKPRSLKTILKLLFSHWTWLRFLTTGESQYAHKFMFARKFLVPLVMQKRALRKHINLPIAMAFSSVCANKIPVLSICAEGGLRALYVETIRSSSLTKSQSGMVTEIVQPGSNHLFTSGRAIERCIEETRNWIIQTMKVPLRTETAHADLPTYNNAASIGYCSNNYGARVNVPESKEIS